MTFDPALWLAVARKSAEPVPEGDPEAWFRTAANRSFYACLMAIARRVIDTQGPSAFPGRDTHAQIKRALSIRKDVPVIRSLRDEFLALEDFREKADYVLTWQCASEWAQEALERGERLVAKIRNLNEKYFASLPV